MKVIQTTPKFPKIKVKLVGIDGNAFSVLAACQRAMKNAGESRDTIDVFMAEAKSGDYDQLLATCQKWFTIH